MSQPCEALGMCYPWPSMGKRKDPAAVRLGRKGGRAYKANSTKAERSAAARKAAQARWRTREGA